MADPIVSDEKAGVVSTPLRRRPKRRWVRFVVIPVILVIILAAGYALWMFVVQREACGLRDSRAVIRDYGVPAEVHNRMGMPVRRHRETRSAERS